MNKLQQYVQSRCVIAAHPGKTLEEAFELEFMKGCVLEHKNKKEEIICCFEGRCTSDSFANARVQDLGGYKIIGLPVTLPRILVSLGTDYAYIDGEIVKKYASGLKEVKIDKWVCKYNLKNEDGTDCLFHQQNEDTQLEIAKLLGYKPK